jgi:protocatechuate 3,4-dioxygenase beta subunit
MCALRTARCARAKGSSLRGERLFLARGRPDPRASSPLRSLAGGARPLRLNRRRALAGAGVLAIPRWLTACSSDGRTAASPEMSPAATGSPDGSVASCLLTPAQTEGPFFYDTGLERRDIRDGKPGALLELGLRVVDAESCAPISGALVEVWHADAAGVYSAFDVAQGNSGNAAGQTFLRGFQATDASGQVEFLSVYPGWYPGRTPHIHIMVLLPGARESALLTTQLYFPESVTDAVYATEPYAARGPRSTTNASDGVGVPSALVGAVDATDGDWSTSFRLVAPRRATPA